MKVVMIYRVDHIMQQASNVPTAVNNKTHVNSGKSKNHGHPPFLGGIGIEIPSLPTLPHSNDAKIFPYSSIPKIFLYVDTPEIFHSSSVPEIFCLSNTSKIFHIEGSIEILIPENFTHSDLQENFSVSQFDGNSTLPER